MDNTEFVLLDEQIIDDNDLKPNGLIISDTHLRALLDLKRLGSIKFNHYYKISKNVSLARYSFQFIRNKALVNNFNSVYGSIKLPFSVEIIQNTFFAVYKGKSEIKFKRNSIFFQHKFLYVEKSNDNYLSIKITQALEDNKKLDIRKGQIFTRKRIMYNSDKEEYANRSNRLGFKNLVSKTDSCKMTIVSPFVYGVDLMSKSIDRYLSSVSDVKMFIASVLKSYTDFNKNNNLIHRDIKPENIIFNPNDFTCKIIDFEFVVKANSYISDKTVGTVRSMAPELLEQILTNKEYKIYNASQDIFSLGLTILWVLFDSELSQYIKLREDRVYELFYFSEELSKDIFIFNDNEYTVIINKFNEYSDPIKLNKEIYPLIKKLSKMISINPLERVLPINILSKELKTEFDYLLNKEEKDYSKKYINR